MLPARLFGSLRPAWRTTRTLSLYQVQARRQLGAFRANSSAASFPKAQGEPSKSPLAPETADQVKFDPSEPRLAIAFTCTADGCNHRSAHTFTKRAYERGIVLIQCPSCKNRYGCTRLLRVHAHLPCREQASNRRQPRLVQGRYPRWPIEERRGYSSCPRRTCSKRNPRCGWSRRNI